MPDNSRDIDTTAAEAYEKYMLPGILGPWAKRGVKAANPQPEEHVLDVACGTGIGARLAAKSADSSGRVVGLDIDPAMLAVARRAEASLEWHCASALDMPFRNATFDLCMCFQGLQFFPDRVAGFSEMRRVLKPAGRLVASVWAPLEFNKGQHAIIAALERQNVDTSTAMKAFSFSDPEEIYGTAERAGFRNIEVRTEEELAHFPSVQAFIDAMATGSLVFRHAIPLLPEDRYGRFVGDVAEMLRSYIDEGQSVFPTRAHIVLARP